MVLRAGVTLGETEECLLIGFGVGKALLGVERGSSSKRDRLIGALGFGRDDGRTYRRLKSGEDCAYMAGSGMGREMSGRAVMALACPGGIFHSKKSGETISLGLYAKGI